ncbi:MAG: DUF3179 domain-containing protein [bacterium]|nr:DUF3179 domain-containing protein [bacterium]
MRICLLIVLALAAASCSTAGPSTNDAVSTPATDEIGPSVESGLVDASGLVFPAAPATPEGPLDDQSIAAIERVWDSLSTQVDSADVVAIGATGDARLAWLLSDLLRFFQGAGVGGAAVDAFNELTGVEIPNTNQVRHWRTVTDHLIAWDTPAPPGYVDYKEQLFTFVEPGWQPFFADADADVDWRLISWGGVRIDDRPLGDLGPCLRGCIPALDDPPATDAGRGDWYADEAIVFGVTVNGESRAYPKNIMEVHEMVNDTLGGRRIGMPYCTLCGSAQAFYTDVVPPGFDSLTLRTSGLLSRSNKVMYDLDSQSMFDTFFGTALTGPLRQADFVLEPLTVVTSTWGDWRAAHPETTIVFEDGGRGISYPGDPLEGRDDNGPIFPVGDVDSRLPVQEQVLGVIAPDGTAIAFPVVAALAALAGGTDVSVGDVRLENDGGGLRAVDDIGRELATHQAFWFAWSQFHPTTAVWSP